MYRQSEKKLVKQQYLPHMSLQYGELRPTSGSDHFVSLGHPSKFERLSHLGSVTAWYSCSGREPNFVVLNRGRHLYSAGRPSRWASAHILVIIIIISKRNGETDDFKVDAGVHRQRQGEERERVKLDARVLTLNTPNTRLELPVKQVDNDGLITQQVVVPRLAASHTYN